MNPSEVFGDPGVDAGYLAVALDVAERDDPAQHRTIIRVEGEEGSPGVPHAAVLALQESPRAQLGPVDTELRSSGASRSSRRDQVGPVLFRTLMIGDDLGG